MFNKKNLIISAVLSLVASFLFASVLILKTVYIANTISEPVKIKVSSDNKDVFNNLKIIRITRGGAEFPLDKISVENPAAIESVSGEWFAGIKIIGPKDVGRSIKSVEVLAGDRTYDFSEKGLTDKWSIKTDDQSQVFTADKKIIRYNDSHLGYFKNIINWPGDSVVLFRAVWVNIYKIIFSCIALFFVIYLYLFWVEKNKIDDITDSEQVRFNQLLVIVLFVVLSAISVVIFIRNSPTAFDWPAMDMGPFFSRQADQNFVLNDFFTNSSSQPNPRFIFGYSIIALKNILHTDWYSVMFLLKVLMVVFLPSLIFVSLGSFFEETESRKKSLIYSSIFLFLLASFNLRFLSIFIIALWPPYEITPVSQFVSASFAFLAIYCANTRKPRMTSYALWFLSTLFHPAIGVSMLAFFLIVNVLKTKKSDYLYFLLFGAVLPLVGLFVMFPVKNPLSTKDFVYHYIAANHPFHYLPTQFVSFNSPVPWYFSFALINVLFVISFFVGIKKKDRFLKILSLLSLLSYGGCVLLEYLFVELHPIKLMATLSPIRFSLAGYWLLAVIYAYVISYLPLKYFPFLKGRFNGNLKKMLSLAGLILLCVVFSAYVVYKDNPFERIWNEKQDIFGWIEKNSTSTDVFVSNNHDLLVDIPLIGNRPVFTGNGFPFREDDFVEFDNRRFLVFGSPDDWKRVDGSWSGIKIDNFYRSLGPSDFVRISKVYPLDYVVVERDFSGAFSHDAPAFENKEFNIYRINDLNKSTK